MALRRSKTTFPLDGIAEQQRLFRPEDLPRASEVDSSFERQGEEDVCKHCGEVREGTAAFAARHYRDCIEPRRQERAQ